MKVTEFSLFPEKSQIVEVLIAIAKSYFHEEYFHSHPLEIVMTFPQRKTEDLTTAIK